MYNTQQPQQQIRVKKFTLIESKEYRDMYLRPFDVDIDHGTMNTIKNTVEHAINVSPNEGINHLAISGYLNELSPNILTPSSNVLGVSNMVNGWGTKRFKFKLELEVTIPGYNSTIINYVQGYSDHLGISYNDTLDPNMNLYINSVVVLRKFYDTTTGITTTTPLYAYSVTSKQTTIHDPSALSLIRPDDIVTKLATLQSTDGDVNFISNVGDLDKVQLVDKDTVLPINHVTKVIGSAINSRFLDGAFSEEADVIGTMSSDLLTQGPESIDFFKLLIRIKGGVYENFTLNDLEYIQPNVQVDVLMNSNIVSMELPSELLTNDTADTYDTSYETRMASLIHSGLVSILDDSLLNEVSFAITNASGMVIDTYFSAGSYIEGLNIPLRYNEFIVKFKKQIWNIISANNNLQIDILITSQIESDTTIKIAINGQSPIIYRYPTFADNAFLPLISNRDHQSVVIDNYSDIVNTAVESVSSVIQKQQNFQQPIYTGV